MLRQALFVLFFLVHILLFGEDINVFLNSDYPGQNLYDEEGVSLIYHGRRDLKHIVLTIDDGWVPDYDLLQFLQDEKIPCTVFIPGKIMKYRPLWIKKMDLQGIEIGSHGYSHRLFPFLTPQEQIEELEETNKILFQITGKTTRLVRPSGGRLDGPYPSLELMREQGYTVVLWENDVRGYFPNDTVESQISWLWDHLQPGNIILSHFGSSLRTKEVLEKWVPLVKKMGYEFITLTELLGELEKSELPSLSNQ